MRLRVSPGYDVIVRWSGEDQAFVAEVPDLPGCAAHGESPEDALREAQEAVALRLETAREFGDSIPGPGSRRPRLA
jgi:predicted RNase H-like HicB family nuclease